MPNKRTATIRRTTTATVTVGAALLLAVGPASATVTRSSSGGDHIGLTSNADPDLVQLECVGGQAREGGVDILPCAAVRELTVDAGAGDDTVDLTTVTAAAFPVLANVTIRAGAGTDTIRGTQIGDDIVADNLDAVLANDGDDVVTGGATAALGGGDDTSSGVQGSTDGGTGDDRIEQPGAGPIVGGPGYDTVALDFSAIDVTNDVGFTITADNIHVEIVGVTQGDITSSVERYEIRLLSDRTQTVDSRAFPGSIDVTGLGGVDVLRAGPGEDFLDGGPGDDQLSGGAGFDYVSGGAGNDSIDVRDGEVDRVVCGDGTDTVVADPADLLAGCEDVQLPAPETSAITGPKKVKAGAKARFTFSSPTVGATFQCQLDARGAWKACSSPYAMRTTKLKPGKHTLRVRAVTSSPDPTPSALTLKVAKKGKKSRG